MTMKRMFRERTRGTSGAWRRLHPAPLAALLLCLSAAAHGESYDKYAYIKSLPYSPISPTETWHCDKWLERCDRIITDVVVAHDACLRVETGKDLGDLQQDTKGSCSKPACEKLHDARTELRAEADKKMAECRATVDSYKKRQESDARTKRQRRLRDAQSNPCIREWLQYEALCVGKHETTAHQKQCQKDLNDLRRRCPDRGG